MAKKNKKPCIEVAVGMLGRRDYSIFDMRQKLTQKEYPEEEIEQAITRLQGLEYLDDHKYARHFVNDKGRLAGWGRMRIELALRQKKIAEEAIEAALQQYEEKMTTGDVPTWTGRATELLERKYGLFEGSLEAKDFQKRMNFLLRRGYDMDQARQALENTRHLPDA